MGKKAKTTTRVKQIINTAVSEAANVSYCINCQFSYLRMEDGHGYCKLQDPDKPAMHLKPIQEFTVCDRWERKK